ncbi:hypothetical protein Slin15195_G117690 [Septoria linicola]|uniref:Uncharacterized protein n=1 Tax=Septoria linicola TaxID=215465 RepID=A0A9Q9B568_9PEZI|nr:hypothetical protein Slin15195_G117690 [Septoria linicola]
MLGVPAVIQLRSMRGLKKVTIYGACTNVKTILEAEMVLAKPSKALPGRGSKRLAARSVKQSATKVPSNLSNSTGSNSGNVDDGRLMSPAFPGDMDDEDDEDTLFVPQGNFGAELKRSGKKFRPVEPSNWSMPEQWSDEVTPLSYGML